MNKGTFQRLPASTLRNMLTDGELGEFYIRFVGKRPPVGKSGLELIEDIKVALKAPDAKRRGR